MMDLPIPSIYGSIFKSETEDPRGCTPASVQQLLLRAYAPKISVLSSNLADEIAKEFGQLDNVHQLFSYFENIFAFGTNYDRPISMNSSNTLSYSLGSGNVRFVDDVLKSVDDSATNLEDLFDSDEFREQLQDYVAVVDEEIGLLNGETLDYNTYHKDYRKISKIQNSIYLKIISLMNLSDKLSPFECFNHPIMQLVVVTGNDTDEDIEKLTCALEKRTYPKWFDVSSVIQLIIILVDQNDSSALQKALAVQENLKIKNGKRSVVVPINANPSAVDTSDSSTIRLYPSIFSRINSKNATSKEKEMEVLHLSVESFNSWKNALQEVISKDLILFMTGKIKQWETEVVAPRTSLTSRIFGGRKWGGGSKGNFFSFGSVSDSKNDVGPENSQLSYSSSGGFYLAQSPEMILRKLADWYFMLGDYKNAYTTYELVKKDMVNDRAYSHLASLQEYTVFALLVGAANRSGGGAQPITSKMVSTVITPMLDSSFYSYLSRSNLKTYTIRLTVIAAELYLLLGRNTALAASQTSLTPNVELFLNESVTLFKKIIDSNLLDHLSCGYLMQRVAYIYGSYDSYIAAPDRRSGIPGAPYYETENESKANVLNPNWATLGLTKRRKMILWLLLSAKELKLINQPGQTKLIVWQIEDQLGSHSLNQPELSWLERKDGLLYKIKSQLD